MGPNRGCDFSTYLRIRKNSLGNTVQSLGRHMMDKYRRDGGLTCNCPGDSLREAQSHDCSPNTNQGHWLLRLVLEVMLSNHPHANRGLIH